METKPKHLLRFKWLLFLLSFLLIPFKASADQITNEQITINDKLSSEGYFEITLCHYDSDGSDEWLHSNNNSYISINGTKILALRSSKSDGDPQGTDTWYWCRAKILDSSAVAKVLTYTRNGEREVTTTETQFNYDENRSTWKTYSTWRIYPSVSFLKNAPTDFVVKVYLRVDFNNGRDYDVNWDKTITFNKPTIPELTWDYSTTAGFQTVTFTGTAGDKYKFDDESPIEISRAGSFSKDYTIQNEEHKSYLTYYKKISNYQLYDATGYITLPAYQWPTDLVLKEEDDCNTTISWTIPKASGVFENGDEFMVQRSTNANFSANLVDVGSIAFDNNKTEYSIVDYTSEENLNSTYYYRLRRTKTSSRWAWSKAVTNSIALSMAHQYIKSAVARMQDDLVNIKWEYDNGKVVSDNSTITIVAYNETGGSQETFKIPSDSIANRSYTFTLSSTCAKFVFNMYVTPGNDRYKAQDAIRVTNAENIITVKMGKIISINASKGYYSDHVELDWMTDGYAVDVFSIQSREYGSNDDFKQIDQVGGNIASDNYQYRDTKAVPGTIYEYQIQAISSCGDATQTRTSGKAIGFRTPTGDIYGTITYKSGQAVEGVEVRLEVADSGAGLAGKNYNFSSSSYLQVDDSQLLNDVTSAVTLQAWVTPADGNVIKKSGMYQLGIANGKATFTAGSQTLTSSVDLSEKVSVSSFVHLTGVMSADSLYIYLNGMLSDVVERSAVVSNVTNPVRIGGEGFVGNIDEVRLWSRALDADEIKAYYNAYLVGGENGLEAYYTFDYAVANNFYDLSYKGNKYNEHHGTVYNATLSSDNIPSIEELGYRAYTGGDGSYTIRAVPYVGNGTSYNIIPRYGSHSFSPTRSLRLLSASSQSHTVNFTDNSSFVITGTVRYQGGTVPVEGVAFYIDGVVAMDTKSNIILSKADGTFAISVPVGIHEVQARLANHEFENDGKITNSDGSDRNYQDNISGNALEIWDTTKIRFIGRVAGGTVQEDVEIGHSASINNLGDGVSITLTYPNDAYKIANVDYSETFDHPIPSNKKTAETNDVATKGNAITIYPNKKTGEFVADIMPLNYNVTLNIPGYENQAKDLGGMLDLTNSFSLQTSTREYRDSIFNRSTETWEYTDYSDEITYNAQQKYIVRVTPTIDVKQIVNGREVAYLGEIKESILVGPDKYDTVAVYDKAKDTYLFGRPVFHQGNEYVLRGSVFEGYTYYDEAGKAVAGKPLDKVPSQKAKVTIKTNMTSEAGEELECNDNGQADFNFFANAVDLTTGMREISASASIDGGTTFSWNNPYPTVICTGSVQEGNNFVTAGPNHVMTVLRDPPGSNSYAFLEKGYSVSSSATYSGSVGEVGEENITTGVKMETIVFAGVGAGKIEKVSEIDSDWGVDIEHSEVYNRENTRSYTFTTNQRFQTSEDPLYDGANGDVFIGESTNIVYGAVQNMRFVSKDRFNAVGGLNSEFYKEISGVVPSDSKYVMVKQTAIGVSAQFATMFAYPQIHIENVLIPNLKTLKNSILHQSTEMTASEFQSLADNTKEAVYVSKLDPSDENYGKSNIDEVFKNDPNYSNLSDGASYKIYYATGINQPNDTILYLNQTIDRWYEELAKNEEAKVKATKLLNNYSIQAGSNVEYSEEYSSNHTTSDGFVISLTVDYNNDHLFGTGSLKTKLEWKEGLTTEQGKTWTNETEATHTKGFVLAEDGDDDYISVDVLYEEIDDKDYNNGLDEEETNKEEGEKIDAYYPAFVFRTRGGVTACPYEPQYVTKYYEPGKHIINQATVQLEKPQLSLKSDFVDNVPSGSPAYITMYLKNESESQEDCWYNLRLVDSSNPNGAKFTMDGAPFASARAILVPAGEIVQKVLEVNRGVGMEFDDITFRLESQCQADPTDFLDDIYSEVSFSVHYTPSASPVSIKTPSNNWTYNTKLPTTMVNGVEKHYMPIQMTDFDVNYEDFYRIRLQYKPASGDENSWSTLMNYYNDKDLYEQSVANGFPSEMINSKDKGTITYRLFLDDLQDQNYDLRAVASSMINNIEYTRESEIHSGIKDMYNPRLFGSAQPANGILTINDEVRLNFNETIAEGYLTQNNFSVTGIRNGAQTDHSVSIELDGQNDYLVSELSRNWTGKDISVEAWIYVDAAQDATIFSHGDSNEALELKITKDKHLAVKVGNSVYKSEYPVDFKLSEWSHVAMVFDAEGYVSAYYNFKPALNRVATDTYDGIGVVKFGCDVNNGNLLKGRIHNARIWDKELSSGRLQTSSLVTLSGNESNLIGYYPMDEARGNAIQDKARGINLSLEGGEWSLPETKAAAFDGKTQYARVRTDNAIFEKEMDYTIEFWFKAEADNMNATMVSNGRADGTDMGGSKNFFAVGFENGLLTFQNDQLKQQVDGSYIDNNWHHFAIAANRITGRAQILIDGVLKSYFESKDLGGVEAPMATIGARAYYLEGNASDLVVDNFFHGSIDEFRMWNLYKNETLIDNNLNTRLDGDEMGLAAYYPFEKYINNQGTKELVFTADDQTVSDNPMSAGEVVGGDIATDIAAPVKNKGAVSKLDYTFVVNNDALIITLGETWNRIEKTIVTFTVDGVRDLNGNEIINPITWSAYIDRNQLKWNETEKRVEISANTETEFAVKVNNNGGSIEHYNIENLPSWLSATPESGTINPSSSTTIKFTIDESLNIGTYDEVIYLRGDNDVLEALELTVKVNGEKPAWNVNPADFKYNMSVFGKIQINSIFSSDSEDLLAAFVGGTCVGVVNNTYNKVNDMYYALLTVYSNEVSVDNLEFRIWDASTGVIYTAVPNVFIKFTNNDIVGEASNPVIFAAKEERVQNIALNRGWTWVSLNVSNNKMNNLNALLSGTNWSNDDEVKTENGGFASYTSNGWVGTLNEMDNKQMYLVYSSEANVLNVTGTPVEAKNNILNIEGGKWNYISYIPTSNLTLKDALAGYDAVKGDVIKSQTGFAMYQDNLGWIGSLTYLESGKGYMLQRKASTDVKLQYPTVASSKAKSKPENRDVIENPLYVKPTSTNMSIVAKVTGYDIEESDILAAYINGELISQTRPIFNDDTEEYLFFITVGCEVDGMPVGITLERDGDQIALGKNDIKYVANNVSGSINDPVMIELVENASTSIDRILRDLPEGSIVTIYDANGRKVDSMRSGVYIVNIMSDGVNNTYKVVK